MINAWIRFWAAVSNLFVFLEDTSKVGVIHSGSWVNSAESQQGIKAAEQGLALIEREKTLAKALQKAGLTQQQAADKVKPKPTPKAEE